MTSETSSHPHGDVLHGKPHESDGKVVQIRLNRNTFMSAILVLLVVVVTVQFFQIRSLSATTTTTTQATQQSTSQASSAPSSALQNLPSQVGGC